MSGTWAAGWLDNDIVTAAEFRKSAGSIFDSTLGGAAATVDITGIVATYAHLLVTLYSRGDTALTLAATTMRFNGDASASYDYQYLLGQAAATSTAETFGATQLVIGDTPAASAGANLFGVQEVFIPHYAGSTNNKQFVSVSAGKSGTATTNMAVRVFGGGWRSSSAINRITFLPGAGNFVAGTRVTVHALGA